MNIIESAIIGLFTNVEIKDLTDKTILESLPGWDSMNAINLQIEIESLAGRSNLGIVLTDKMTIHDIKLELRKRGVTIE